MTRAANIRGPRPLETERAATPGKAPRPVHHSARRQSIARCGVCDRPTDPAAWCRTCSAPTCAACVAPACELTEGARTCTVCAAELRDAAGRLERSHAAYLEARLFGGLRCPSSVGGLE